MWRRSSVRVAEDSSLLPDDSSPEMGLINNESRWWKRLDGDMRASDTMPPTVYGVEEVTVERRRTLVVLGDIKNTTDFESFGELPVPASRVKRPFAALRPRETGSVRDSFEHSLDRKFRPKKSMFPSARRKSNPDGSFVRCVSRNSEPDSWKEMEPAPKPFAFKRSRRTPVDELGFADARSVPDSSFEHTLDQDFGTKKSMFPSARKNSHPDGSFAECVSRNSEPDSWRETAASTRKPFAFKKGRRTPSDEISLFTDAISMDCVDQKENSVDNTVSYEKFLPNLASSTILGVSTPKTNRLSTRSVSRLNTSAVSEAAPVTPNPLRRSSRGKSLNSSESNDPTAQDETKNVEINISAIKETTPEPPDGNESPKLKNLTAPDSINHIRIQEKSVVSPESVRNIKNASIKKALSEMVPSIVNRPSPPKRQSIGTWLRMSQNISDPTANLLNQSEIDRAFEEEMRAKRTNPPVRRSSVYVPGREHVSCAWDDSDRSEVIVQKSDPVPAPIRHSNIPLPVIGHLDLMDDDRMDDTLKPQTPVDATQQNMPSTEIFKKNITLESQPRENLDANEDSQDITLVLQPDDEIETENIHVKNSSDKSHNEQPDAVQNDTHSNNEINIVTNKECIQEHESLNGVLEADIGIENRSQELDGKTHTAQVPTEVSDHNSKLIIDGKEILISESTDDEKMEQSTIFDSVPRNSLSIKHTQDNEEFDVLNAHEKESPSDQINIRDNVIENCASVSKKIQDASVDVSKVIDTFAGQNQNCENNIPNEVVTQMDTVEFNSDTLVQNKSNEFIEVGNKSIVNVINNLNVDSKCVNDLELDADVQNEEISQIPNKEQSVGDHAIQMNISKVNQVAVEFDNVENQVLTNADIENLPVSENAAQMEVIASNVDIPELNQICESMLSRVDIVNKSIKQTEASESNSVVLGKNDGTVSNTPPEQIEVTESIAKTPHEDPTQMNVIELNSVNTEMETDMKNQTPTNAHEITVDAPKSNQNDDRNSTRLDIEQGNIPVEVVQSNLSQIQNVQPTSDDGSAMSEEVNAPLNDITTVVDQDTSDHDASNKTQLDVTRRTHQNMEMTLDDDDNWESISYSQSKESSLNYSVSRDSLDPSRVDSELSGRTNLVEMSRNCTRATNLMRGTSLLGVTDRDDQNEPVSDSEIEFYTRRLRELHVQRVNRAKEILKAAQQNTLDQIKASTLHTHQRPTKKTAKQKAVKKSAAPSDIDSDVLFKRPKLYKKESWITNNLYSFLQKKLRPRYGIKTTARSEKLVMDMARVVNEVINNDTDYYDYVNDLKEEMARLEIVDTHHDFHCFVERYLPFYFRIKVLPTFGRKLPVTICNEEESIPFPSR